MAEDGKKKNKFKDWAFLLRQSAWKIVRPGVWSLFSFLSFGSHLGGRPGQLENDLEAYERKLNYETVERLRALHKEGAINTSTAEEMLEKQAARMGGYDLLQTLEMYAQYKAGGVLANGTTNNGDYLPHAQRRADVILLLESMNDEGFLTDQVTVNSLNQFMGKNLSDSLIGKRGIKEDFWYALHWSPDAAENLARCRDEFHDEGFPSESQNEIAEERASDYRFMAPALEETMRWLMRKTKTLPSLDAAVQGDFARSLKDLCQNTPVRTAKNDQDLALFRTKDNVLCAVFKRAVNEEGQPLAAFEYKAAPVAQVISYIEKRGDQENQPILEFLRRYQSAPS